MADDGPRPGPEDFTRALQWHRARVPMNTASRGALDATARERAFTIAGVTELDAVADVWRGLDRAIADGQSLEEFKRDVAPRLLESWQGTVTNPSARVELIFRNATQRAYNAGRVAELKEPAIAKVFTHWKFDAVGDARTSSICRALDGTLRPASDPWWETHTPPCHHACRSTIHGVRARQADREGVTQAPHMSAAEGFGAMPGAGREWTPNPADYPPELWRAHQQSAHQHPATSVQGNHEAIGYEEAVSARDELLDRFELRKWVERNGVRIQINPEAETIQERRPDGSVWSLLGRYLDPPDNVVELSRVVSTDRERMLPGGAASGVVAGASTDREAFQRIAMHELAHAIMAHSSVSHDGDFLRLWKVARREHHGVTAYARRDSNEFAAESITAFFFEPDLLDEDGSPILEDGHSETYHLVRDVLVSAGIIPPAD